MHSMPYGVETMELFGHEIDSWIIASLLACLMIAGWTLGWRRGKSVAAAGKVNPSTINDAILALFGLLLGFTFSMSLAKHDQRRLMLVNDSNCIGDFSTCVSLLKQPQQGKLLSTIKEYLKLLLKPVTDASDKAAVVQRLDTIQHLLADMQRLVGEAIPENTAMVVPLVNTYNGLTSSHASRLATLRDRLPSNIMFLLSIAGLITMVLQGQRQGETGNNLFSPSLGFILLASMVIWITLDLNEPNRGWITISKEPLERVLAGLP